jgi:hypothetical protein
MNAFLLMTIAKAMRRGLPARQSEVGAGHNLMLIRLA